MDRISNQFCDSLKKFVGKQQNILFVHMSYIKVKIEREETKGQDMGNSTRGQISSGLDNTQAREPVAAKKNCKHLLNISAAISFLKFVLMLFF